MSTFPIPAHRFFSGDEKIINAVVVFIHPTTDAILWLCKNMINTFSISDQEGKAFRYAEVTKDDVTEFAKFAKTTMPNYALTVIKASVH